MVRSGEIVYSQKLADCLLDAMDFVMELCGDIEKTESIGGNRAENSVHIAEALRALMPAKLSDSGELRSAFTIPRSSAEELEMNLAPKHFDEIPEVIRQEAVVLSQGTNLHWIVYSPEPECFFRATIPFIARDRCLVCCGVAPVSERLFRRLRSLTPIVACLISMC
jgi:two-component system chemotaxis sensor kinase CheA